MKLGHVFGLAVCLLVGPIGTRLQSVQPAHHHPASPTCASTPATPPPPTASYTHIVGATKGADPQNPQGARYYLSPTQFIEVLPLPAQHTLSRMACVAYSTPRRRRPPHLPADASRRQPRRTTHRQRRAAAGSTPRTPKATSSSSSRPAKLIALPASARPIGTRIIHVGYLVHSKPAEDAFYRALLGFRPYWFGAMQPEHLDWVSQQVPDGHDWLEYMLVATAPTSPSTTSMPTSSASSTTSPSASPIWRQAVTTLIAEDRESPRHDGPQMGKDGKWQANLYDPDGTRVELMEFQPVTKPCCSAFTATSPIN